MVQLIVDSNTYNHLFQTALYAYLNKYPNPFASHVLSSDTIERHVDSQGRLRTTKLVVKEGKLPHFMRPFLGGNLHLFVIEKSIIDPKLQTLDAYCANVDHRKFLKVEEYLQYKCGGMQTSIEARVKISSNFVGFKEKIEKWCHDKFTTNMTNSRNGLMYVMTKFERRQPS